MTKSKSFWLLGTWFLTLPLHGLLAQSLESPLFAIEKSLRSPQKLEVLALESPRVLYLSSNPSPLLNAAKVAFQTRSWVKLDFNPHTFEITQLELIDKPLESAQPYSWNATEFKTSTLLDKSQARFLFDSVDTYSDSDLSDNCYARAHYWARSFELSFDIRSMKVFVLFTPLYRNAHNFDWWYHVAPFVPVENEPAEESQVLDPSYETAPKPLRDWVFHFASKAQECRVAKTLSEYYDQLALGGCVVILANMYHYTPTDLAAPSLRQWKCQHFRNLQTLLRAPRPYTQWQDYEDFLPEHCY